MSSVTQIIFIITSFIISISLLVGLILISISLFNIKSLLKKRNHLLEQTSRPYILCRKINSQQLEFRNAGNTPGKITKIDTDSNANFNNLIGTTIFSNQTYTFNINPTEKFEITVNYRDQINNYQSSFSNTL
ncbi:hypothetical protein COSHB9_02370 [Companilactobacillus alimentarius]|uniref:Uncharacterized protein n=1 Tax=Companilactobacillus alimentarius DSM 20249 TaxID=1423720 RepID=A0A2K9HFL6_9LACO|nr:hypothetical protein [Companilactobacillus alimentarius]AUI71340.1 hypothetical protein LA20249_03635 [Companilactobacillus alimentarius DSM 20249]KRK74762.1 hypothetical protein FC67_GL002182 [Companilactobacillus alimentarius DSM 20249]MDT6951339.1 hypothetical protein [Companilactobacillus alimentarius]GEO44323.1 hypothetical protein LAL01_05550 [Companilactobacillus alimentarius]